LTFATCASSPFLSSRQSFISQSDSDQLQGPSASQPCLLHPESPVYPRLGLCRSLEGRANENVELDSHMLDGRCLLVGDLLGSLLSVGFPGNRIYRREESLSASWQGRREGKKRTYSLGSAGLIILLTAPNALVFRAFDPPLPPFLDLAILSNSADSGVVEREKGRVV